MINKIMKLDKEFKDAMNLLLNECEDDYDRCMVYSKIGVDHSYIIRGNKYLDQFIDCRLENGYRHCVITFEDAYEYVNDWFGEEGTDSLAKFWADHKLKSMELDW